jgi:succinate-semialdehyde dehydrogenase/glutarate-semialdehyde dehydrogenase
MAPDLPDFIRTKAFIGGKWMSAQSGTVFEVCNPADGSVLASVADTGKADADLAVGAAFEAFQEWSAMLPSRRYALMSEWSRLIRANADDLALVMTLEQGKPLGEAKGEVLAAADTVQWCAEEGKRAYGEYIEGSKPCTKIIVSHHPIGVVGAITPWNFPVGMITRKVAPALAAGCTVVLKPAEDTPLCALALAELALRASLPEGVFNVIPSSKPEEIGKTLTEDSRVRKISFTGSTAVGKALMAQAAGNLQKLSLELGGNAPFIVTASADLGRAVEGCVISKFRNAGQTCICANRIFVQKAVYEAFKKSLLEKIEKLKVGSGKEKEKDVMIGPLINRKAVSKVEKLVNEAKAKGASVLTGGERHKAGECFYKPTLIEGVADESALFKEEIFGPVAVLYAFDSVEEVLERANSTPYGLAAYIYSQNQNEIWNLSDQLQFGMVGVNEPLLASDLAPFGGIKESGVGRESGRYGLLEYMELKYRLFS